MAARSAKRAIGRSGDLDCGALAALDGVELVGLWRRLHRRSPPPALRGELLVRVLAHQLQTTRHGGLSPAAKLRLKQAVARGVADTSIPSADSKRASLPACGRTLRPGTRLVREWRGTLHEVEVLADGYAWQGASYRSLSAIAKAITGSNWNGWTFFGIDRPRGKAGKTEGAAADD